MPFPYLSPIKNWTKEVLEYRESNPNAMLEKMPYAVLSSAALVVKGNSVPNTGDRIEQYKNAIRNPQQYNQKFYQGCVITNNIDPLLNYQKSETVLGIDFSGKQIVVEGESNRRVSTPIIESIEIDTDGANNTLKTARVNIKCFTLKQLEMFEVFFLKPGMSLFLEFGDSSLLRAKPQFKNITDAFSSINQCLEINNLDYNKFVETFVSFSSPNNQTVKGYYDKLRRSIGSYDFVAGKVTNFSYSIDEQGTYNVDLEISQGNQFTLAIPHNTGKETTEAKTAAKNLNVSQIFEQSKLLLSYDLDIEYNRLNNYMNANRPDNDQNKTWEKNFFNWGKLNIKQEDELVSLKPYLSLRFIIKILANISVTDNPQFEFKPTIFKVGETTLKDTEFIPVRSHKNLISSSELILFPGTIPQLALSNPKETELKFSGSLDCSIHGYSFNSNLVKIQRVDEFNQNKFVVLKDEDTTDGYVLGNALNCFILYEQVVQIWRKSFTRLDFIEQILRLVNENCYGIFELHAASPTDPGQISIIDYKLNAKEDTNVSEENIYRFKPTTIYSTVKSFSFNMELSDLVAGQSVFNNQKLITSALSNKNASGSFETLLTEKTYKSVNMAQYTTSDGYYAIDRVNFEVVNKNIDKLTKQHKENITNVPASTTNESDEVTKDSPPDVDKLIKSKLKTFKTDDKNPKLLPLVFTDSAIIKGLILKSVAANSIVKSTLTPIEVSLTIDGISGLSCGEYFKIDGVPETYNRDGVFQITNVKHNIGTDGWTTEIVAGWRIIN